MFYLLMDDKMLPGTILYIFLIVHLITKLKNN